jgi:glycosyltransferase involved in cell wall biosynthesis
MSPAKPRLLLIGHPYAALENRKKVQALAAHFDLTCVTSTMEDGIILGRPASDFDNESDAAQRRYELIRLPRSRKSTTTFRYLGLHRVLRSRSFEIVLVENEPWAAICWQARLLTGLFQPHCKFGIFTWENVERPSWKGWLLGHIYRAMTATTDFIIAGNQAAKALVVKRGARPADVHVDAQLGVDLSSHAPADPTQRSQLRRAHGLPMEALVIGYCGRLTDEKGLRELLTACERHQPLHLALLGAGPLKPWLEEQARLLPWLHLLPPRPHWEIPDFLRCLDLFVLASQPVRSLKNCWEEQFGHVLIEAMACGVSTLGSDSGAIPEVIGMKEAIFRHSDADALGSVLGSFCQNVSARQELAQRQLERTRQQYSHEAVAQRWAGFIFGIMEDREPLR